MSNITDPEPTGQRPYFDAAGNFLGSINNSRGCQHPPDQRKRDGGCHSGCCDDYVCTGCNTRFRIEVPD